MLISVFYERVFTMSDHITSSSGSAIVVSVGHSASVTASMVRHIIPDVMKKVVNKDQVCLLQTNLDKSKPLIEKFSSCDTTNVTATVEEVRALMYLTYFIKEMYSAEIESIDIGEISDVHIYWEHVDILERRIIDFGHLFNRLRDLLRNNVSDTSTI